MPRRALDDRASLVERKWQLSLQIAILEWLNLVVCTKNWISSRAVLREVQEHNCS